MNNQPTVVSTGTVLLPGRAGLTVKLVIALFIEDAVVVLLLQGEPHAVRVVEALFHAVLKMCDAERVDEVALALEGAVTFSCGTAM